MKVLLVDDEKDIVSTLAERLSLRGIEAVWVTSGTEALEILKTTQFDLAILDVKMPSMNGLELQRKMTEKYKNLKYLFLTSRGAEGVLEPGAQLVGEDFYLSKPIKMDKLLKKMDEALGK